MFQDLRITKNEIEINSILRDKNVGKPQSKIQEYNKI